MRSYLKRGLIIVNFYTRKPTVGGSWKVNSISDYKYMQYIKDRI